MIESYWQQLARHKYPAASKIVGDGPFSFEEIPSSKSDPNEPSDETIVFLFADPLQAIGHLRAFGGDDAESLAELKDLIKVLWPGE